MVWNKALMRNGLISTTLCNLKKLWYQVLKVNSNTPNMDENNLNPPKHVAGMKVLDRDAFKKTVSVSFLDVKKESFNDLKKVLVKYMVKMPGVKGIEEVSDNKHRILFDPSLLNTFDDFSESEKAALSNTGIGTSNFGKTSLSLTYKNWKADPILTAVLPTDEPQLKSYSLIGHIIHLNIKDYLLDYKNVIGEVLLDKVPQARTVVYKKDIINNVYRNFEMEVLCGDPDFMVTCIEYGAKFEFDFSKVYWNPRLSTEHERIISLLKQGDALFDVFAGVGPFAIRAAIKRCLVFANDLNPDSYKWLNHNIGLNKKSKDYITTFNKDGGEFILTDAKEHILELWANPDFYGKIHFVMNLPALALTFIKHFKGLITEQDIENLKLEHVENSLPIIHCYFFVKSPSTDVEIFEKHTGMKFDENLHKLSFVRNVALGKSMMRVTFQIPLDYLVTLSTSGSYREGSECSEPLAKRICKNL